MRWEGREESSNVQDKRGMAMPAGGMALGGGLGTLILIVIVMLLGGDPSQLLSQWVRKTKATPVGMPMLLGRSILLKIPMHS